MQPPQSDIEFYQSLCPALKDDKWEWSDHQSFLSPRAMRFVRHIQFNGVESQRLASVYVYYHNDSLRCWFSVMIRGLNYPDFLYNEDLNCNACKVSTDELFTQANLQARSLLVSNFDNILAKEQEWLDELERSKTKLS